MKSSFIHWVIIILAFIWLILQPGFEPIITLLMVFSTIISAAQQPTSSLYKGSVSNTSSLEPLHSNVLFRIKVDVVYSLRRILKFSPVPALFVAYILIISGAPEQILIRVIAIIATFIFGYVTYVYCDEWLYSTRNNRY